ncbi:MAG: DUF1254 domain-containing protein, partial [Longimicrobiales bacterium]
MKDTDARNGPLTSSKQERAIAGEATLDEAFEYAFPLVEMARLRLADLGAQEGMATQRLHAWHHSRKLFSPEDRWVTTPNTDTLYSSLWLDLSRGPIRLTLPDFAGRYYSLAFIDMATNNFAMAGRRTSGTRAMSLAVVGPDWAEPLPTGMRVIRAPANDVLVFARILVNGEADVANVVALQDQFSVDVLGMRAGPPVWNEDPPAGDGPAAFVDMANIMVGRNPPPAYETRLLARFASVGIDGASRWAGLSAEVRAAWEKAWPALCTGLASASASGEPTFNGWRYSNDLAGNFGTNYAQRARTALRGLLALEPVEAYYAGTGVDQHGEPLRGAHRYRLRLSPKDLPVNAFWSLSMYSREPDGRSYFVANPIRRYAIGDRTAGLVVDSAGVVDLCIQHDAPQDSNQRANWVPAPAGDFRVTLRAYEPGAALRDG